METRVTARPPGGSHLPVPTGLGMPPMSDTGLCPAAVGGLPSGPGEPLAAGPLTTRAVCAVLWGRTDTKRRAPAASPPAGRPANRPRAAAATLQLYEGSPPASVAQLFNYFSAWVICLI